MMLTRWCGFKYKDVLRFAPEKDITKPEGIRVGTPLSVSAQGAINSHIVQ
jgi:hypothetical protein